MGKTLFPVPTDLCYVGPRFLAPDQRIIPPGNKTMVPLNSGLSLPPGHFGLLVSLSQQAEKGVTMLAIVIDLDRQKGNCSAIS